MRIKFILFNLVLFGTIYAITAGLFKYITKNNSASLPVDPPAEEKIFHDWESKFVIVDCFSAEGRETYHYIDEYKRNDDYSISFVGEDGLITTLPYPYFQIIVNK